MKINRENAKSFLTYVTHTFEDRKNELSGYDAVIGDGDHGFSIARGCRGGMSAVTSLDSSESCGRLFVIYGRKLTCTIGGAIGPLFGTLFTQIGKNIDGELELDSFYRGIDGAYKAISGLGGAVPGDKTMIDAIYPTAESLKASLCNAESFSEALAKAVCACEDGVLKTIPMSMKLSRN